MIEQDESTEPREGERDQVRQQIDRRLKEIERALRDLEEKLGR